MHRSNAYHLSMAYLGFRLAFVIELAKRDRLPQEAHQLLEEPKGGEEEDRADIIRSQNTQAKADRREMGSVMLGLGGY